MRRLACLILIALFARPCLGVDRLEDLDPGDPVGYFELAETVLRRPEGEADVALARRLLVLALTLDRERAEPTGAGPSACLALAEVAQSESERVWLRAIAARLDARYASPDTGEGGGGLGATDRTALNAATALGLVRAGKGPGARALLRDPAVHDLLERFETQLSGGSGRGALRSIELEADIWPDSACRGERIVRVAKGDDDPDAVDGYELCPVCGGDAAPFVSRARLERELATEWLLLRASSPSWAAQIAAGGGEPLRDPDPASVAEVYGVDPEACVFRGGQWVRPEPVEADSGESAP